MKPYRFLFTLTLMLMIYASPAIAEFTYQPVSPPGAEVVQVFGINDDGIVAGVAYEGVTTFSFTYDMESGEYTVISNDFAVTEISNSGEMVGQVGDDCAIRDKKGNITTFFPTSWAVGSICTARGVNSKGNISGYLVDDLGVWLGFIYDPKKDTYEEFLPSVQTIAHAINGKGQNAGSEFLFEGDAYPGSEAGRYGYLRQTDGSVKYFEISQSLPGYTRGRGISDNGLIAGFYTDPNTFEWKSFVTTLSDGNEFETITLADDEVVYQKPCNPDLPPPLGPGYELFTNYSASQVRNDGVVVGSCDDTYFNDSTGDVIIYYSGFIATPVE